ncbi:MAG: leucyl aminopeptidase [Chlorobiaceae bacterium]|nr:leucyl aminopeptidase [Chlorobiaceae bacterium]
MTKTTGSSTAAAFTLTVTAKPAAPVKTDLLVLPFGVKELKKLGGKTLKGLGLDESPLSDFKAGAGDLAILYRTVSGKGSSRVALLGLGQGKSNADYRKAFESLASRAVELHCGVVTIDCEGVGDWAKHARSTPERIAGVMVEAILFGRYRFDRLKSGKLDKEKNKEEKGKPEPITELVLAGCGALADAIRKGADAGLVVGTCQNMSRELVNLPGNHLTAEDLAQAARDAGKRGGFDVTVFDREKIAGLGMGGLLAVNQGSKESPTFTVMEYRPEGKTKKTVALVGKGITFDSGGISIKPSAGMDEMKSDMAGAACVIGVLEAVSKLALPLRVIGLVPATDNMPSGSALKPGDVITTMSGITVDVGNTDAEGRLILADALTYAKREYAPDVIIDLATLTGACIVALGMKVAGMFSNDDELADEIFKSGQAAGEKVWRLPLWDEYAEQIKSDVADVSNTGSKGAGTITAAKFLENFVEGHKRWAHIDIAGPAFVAKGGGSGSGGTGFGVRLLVDLLKSWG